MSTCRLGVALMAALLFGGCAGPVQHWIVDTRVHQGDVALQHGNANDANLSYGLALRVDPTDVRARAGIVESSADLAQEQYTKGKFDDALETINGGLTYDPQSVRLDALKATVEAAKLKREIVISNYPTYHEAGTQIQRAYEALNTTNKSILADLKRFSYTYETGDLTGAIKKSYDLELEVARNTNRLITYRQIVSSGVPETATQSTAGGAASLLPLP